MAKSAPRIVSVGQSCVTKFQIARHFYFQKHPTDDLNTFRGQVVDPADRSIEFDTHIFDWQITPFPAVITYLRRDFVGVFELDDIAIDPARGTAVNTAMCTSHAHAFHPAGERLTTQDIREQYPSVREKFDHLADKFRGVLASDGPVIYISSFIIPTREVTAFVECLARRNYQQRFRLAMVGIRGQQDAVDVSAFGGSVSCHFVDPPSKSAKVEWEGDDESWEQVLVELCQQKF
jgi:hypothetical protein